MPHSPVPQAVSISGDRAVTKFKWVIRVNPTTMWLVSLEEQGIWTHGETPEVHGHRGSEKANLCKPGREVSEGTKPAETPLNSSL